MQHVRKVSPSCSASSANSPSSAAIASISSAIAPRGTPSCIISPSSTASSSARAPPSPISTFANPGSTPKPFAKAPSAAPARTSTPTNWATSSVAASTNPPPTKPPPNFSRTLNAIASQPQRAPAPPSRGGSSLSARTLAEALPHFGNLQSFTRATISSNIQLQLPNQKSPQPSNQPTSNNHALPSKSNSNGLSRRRAKR